MLAYLKFIQFDNLMIIVLAQLCVKYGLFEPFDVPITLNGFGITLLIIATTMIAAAGNIVIHMYDPEVTKKRVVSERIANRLFIILNMIGVLIGFYLANIIERPGFAALFIIVSGIFYIYASYLKEIIVLKNIIIGILAGLSLLAVGIFDLLPAITEKNRESQTVIFSIIFDYSLFAFLIIVIREIIKDCMSIDHHHNIGIKTIPIVLGKDRTVKLIGALLLIPIASVTYYIYTYLFSNTIAVLAALLFLVAPLLYVMVKSFNAGHLKQLKQLSLILKVILIIASLSLVFYQFILK